MIFFAEVKLGAFLLYFCWNVEISPLFSSKSKFDDRSSRSNLSETTNYKTLTLTRLEKKFIFINESLFDVFSNKTITKKIC
jgi:hypothetical protein